MATEIERKFLVKNDDWRKGAEPMRTSQGYLAAEVNCTVRVRLQEDQGFVTIKGKTEGVSRLEYEYPIPASDARELLDRLCQQPCIEKNRYNVMFAGMKWEVDEFLKENEGLVVAEIELESEEQEIELPPWVGDEVSDDHRYSNVSLTRHPYREWRSGG